MSKATSVNGDVFIARECYECGGLVIEKYVATEDRGERNVNLDNEPHELIDVPTEQLQWLAAAVTDAIVRSRPKCENCGQLATHADIDDVRLCERCYESEVLGLEDNDDAK